MAIRTRLSDTFTLFVVVALLFSVLYPIAATAGVDATGEEPTACIESPNRTVPASDAAVTGVVSQEGKNGGVVNVTYDVGDAGEALTVRLPPNAEWLDGSGFDDPDPGSATWRANASADAHWFTYRMSDMGSFIENEKVVDAGYPHDDAWLIAALPFHDDVDVSLEPAESGYVGANTLYLGNFTLERRTVGCQTFELVVPAETSPLFDPVDRLDDLEVAAKNVPTDRHYDTVTVFVSPVEMGDVGGFVTDFESDIVIVDHQYGIHPSILWIHEYVHTQQRDTLADDMTWTIEASANYLSYQIALENGLVSPLYYDSLLASGADAEPGGSLEDTAHGTAPYARGAALLARIDHDLEAEGNATMDDLLAWLNDHPNTAYDDLREFLLVEADLPEETVASYDAVVLEDEPVEPPYVYGFSDRVPPQAWQLNVLLLPTIRLASISILGLFVGTIALQYVLGRFGRDAEVDRT